MRRKQGINEGKVLGIMVLKDKSSDQVVIGRDVGVVWIRDKANESRNPGIFPNFNNRVTSDRKASSFFDQIFGIFDTFPNPIRIGIRGVIGKKVLMTKVFRRKSFNPERIIKRGFRGKFPGEFRNKSFVEIKHFFKANTSKRLRFANTIPTLRHKRVSIAIRAPPKFSKSSIKFIACKFGEQNNRYVIKQRQQ